MQPKGNRIEADYLIETGFDPIEAAEAMAGEQSTGTFVALPGETPGLKARAAARVESVEVTEEVGAPSIPGAAWPAGRKICRAIVTISWPVENLGPSLPNLAATVGGNLFELRYFSGLRILDIRLPCDFAESCPGPRFSVAGTRKLAGVQGRPLIGTIIKPSVGLSPRETGDLVRELAEAGIDFIKDDELQADGPGCPFEDRVRAVMQAINEASNRHGRKVMYAFNLTGEIDEMRRRHDFVAELGGTCVMVSLNSVGLSGLVSLARHSVLPIHAHRNGWGALTRHPMLGWSYVAWQKLWRLAGADHMHVNGLSNKFCEDDDSVMLSARTCLTPLFESKPCLAMPVFSSGQSARQVESTYKALGSTDLIFLAGGGLMGHPDGPVAGLCSLREAWDAAIAGVPAIEYAKSHPALAHALEAYA